MGNYDTRDIAELNLDFAGDSECHAPDSHLEKRFPVTAIVPQEIELGKAA